MIPNHHYIRKTSQLTVFAATLLAAGALVPVTHAADAAAPTAAAESADDEAKAWSTLELALKAASKQPDEWRTKRPGAEELKAYRLQQAEGLADRLAEYLAKFPKGAHASDARKLQLAVLQSAATAGSKTREKELYKILTANSKDTTLSEDDRVSARIMLVQVDAMKLGGTDRKAAMKMVADSLLAVQKDHPKNEQVYQELMGLTRQVEGTVLDQVLKAVAGSPSAPARLKQRAQDMLDGKIFNAAANIGKPVDIKFTAVDGTEVDLAKLKGKVVLVDFWATWCGPCVAEIPNVKAAYEKYHDKGFEIVGISFDREGDKEKLVKFTKDKGMPWPQYFDGKFWSNDFGKRFGIESIPTMWLIDKEGNLADANARDNLAEKVAFFLDKK